MDKSSPARMPSGALILRDGSAYASAAVMIAME